MFIIVTSSFLFASDYCAFLYEIKKMPFKEFIEGDKAYRSLIRAEEQAIPCLIDKIVDTKQADIISQSPGDHNLKIGDIAFYVLLDITGLDFDYLFPDDVKLGYREKNGIFSYLEFINKQGNRELFQNSWGKWYDNNKKYFKNNHLFMKADLPAKETILKDISEKSVKEEIERLYSIDQDERLDAAYKLRVKKKQATPAVPFLIVLLKDEDVLVRNEAVKALNWIGDARSVEPLIETLKDHSWMVRESAVYALGKIGNNNAIAPLENLLGKELEHWRVKKAAEEAIRKIAGRSD